MGGTGYKQDCLLFGVCVNKIVCCFVCCVVLLLECWSVCMPSSHQSPKTKIFCTIGNIQVATCCWASVALGMLGCCVGNLGQHVANKRNRFIFKQQCCLKHHSQQMLPKCCPVCAGLVCKVCLIIPSVGQSLFFPSKNKSLASAACFPEHVPVFPNM